jgi:uncharacterized protein (TIGR02186 family)
MIRLLLILALLFPLAASAKPLVADLSQYTIQIDSGFNGTSLLLFGARNETGDIVIVVRGPEKQIAVRKKERVAGIWINTETQRFDNVPMFYSIASSKPFANIPHQDLFVPLHIGFEQAFNASRDQHYISFAPALVRHEQNQHLYSQTVQKVSFMGESLFKYVIPFPDNIPRGDYSADVYLFNDGQLSGMQSIPLHVDKSGFDAFIYDLAHLHSALYGFAAVLIALAIGWCGSTLMHRL